MNFNNIAILEGNLTKDPEYRSLESGSKVCNFTVACNDRYKNKEGEWVDKVEFINVVFWREKAEVISKHFEKGSRIKVWGSISTDKSEHEGKTRYFTKVVGSDFAFVGPKKQTASAPVQGVSEDEDNSLPF